MIDEKLVFLLYSDAGDDMKVWYHPRCMFETLVRARATTKKIETADDLEDFTTLEDPEKEEIRKLLKGALKILQQFIYDLTIIYITI